MKIKTKVLGTCNLCKGNVLEETNISPLHKEVISIHCMMCGAVPKSLSPVLAMQVRYVNPTDNLLLK